MSGLSGVCRCTYVYMNMHVYLCVSVLWLPLRERRQCCRQVNPALRLSIKLSDQRINNSDSSLSGSITEHRLRGRQRHNKGTEVIYSLMQLTHIQIKVDEDSLRNCALLHSYHSKGYTRAMLKSKETCTYINSHTQRGTP